MQELASRTEPDRPTRRDSVPFAYVNGLRTYAFRSREELIGKVSERPTILVALNAEKMAAPSPELQRLVEENVGYPDGAGAVLALRRKGLRAVRIPGTELWLDLVRRFAGRRRFYLVGGSTAVIEETVRRLRRQFPDLEIANFRSGFLRPGDADRLAQDLRATRADVVLVAMGSPRQEALMERLLAEHPALYLGLGGSFDVYSGRKRRAPRFMQRAGLEWLFRALQDPVARLPRQKPRLLFALRLLTGRL